ncbi:hypothetical protein Mgra_00005688 [Meloidogyne graminicola]|uniref:Uncharacterized protein n=1 Tax=Meloidogyne graminicola TaxID=189291 RepID=A0A8S9ZP13_9BILA|nr:hypothetical protein Mgra_00005688 [Meloidogyne graminicola]
MMNEATTTLGDDSVLSVLDSSKGSCKKRLFSASAFVESPNNTELIGRLNRQIRDLQSDNLELTRAIPHLKDYKGDDCTKFVTEKLNELEEHKSKCRKAVDRLAENDANEKIKEKETRLIELTNIAEGLENENSVLRDRLRNEESYNYHLQHNGSRSPTTDRVTRSFEKCLEHLDQSSDGESDLRSGISPARTERADSEREHSLGLLLYALFDRLRTTSDNFTQIYSKMANDAQNAEQIKLVEKIKDLRLDLNRSIEFYSKKFQELHMNSPSSRENSLQLEEPAGSIQSCSTCKNIEEERDTLKAQLNREILLKNECLASKDELDKNFREARRSIDEMRSALTLSNNKIEDLQQKLQRNEYYYQGKYGGSKEPEITALHEQINDLRKRNLELDAKNEQILKVSQRIEELNREEFDKKDIELQEKMTDLERCEENIKQLQERCRQLEMDNNVNFNLKMLLKLREELRRNDIMLGKHRASYHNIRNILFAYEKYFDNSNGYELTVEQSNNVIVERINEGRSTSSAASIQNL